MEILLGTFATEWQQRKAAFLHDLSLGRSAPDDKERRRRGGVAAQPKSVAKTKIVGFSVGRGYLDGTGVRRPADRPMRARFAGFASGSQPAVVKLASFGGGARVGAMINYVSRNGAVVVENERGELLQGRDQIVQVGKEWDHLLKNRAESRDIGLFTIAIDEDQPEHGARLERARAIVKHALGERAFAIAVTERPHGRGFDIDGVTVLRDQCGERLTADARASDIVQHRLDAEEGEAVAKFRFTGHGNGTDYGASRLRSLVEKHAGLVHDNDGRVIADAKTAGDLVQLEWRQQLHSRKPRDVMHVILSARAGTDASAFQNAARDFLASQFSTHRYVFSLHDISTDPKPEKEGGKRPHNHVHAIVAMRSDDGERIVTTISTFREWRLNLAEKARANGIEMEMSDRRDRASPAAYRRNQVKPVNTIGRTKHEGTSKAAQRRYDAQRRDEPAFAATRAARSYQAAARREWLEISDGKRLRVGGSFAETQSLRLMGERSLRESTAAGTSHSSKLRSPLRTHMVKFENIFSEADGMRHMARPEFEAYEKRVETALFHAERSMLPHDRRDFEQIAQAARDHVNIRRELLELTEQRAANDKEGTRSPGQDRVDYQPESQGQSDGLERRGVEDHEAATAPVEKEGSREVGHAAEIEHAFRRTQAERVETQSEPSRMPDADAINREAAGVDEELGDALPAADRARHGEWPASSTEPFQSRADRGSIPHDSPEAGRRVRQPGHEDSDAPSKARDSTIGDMTQGDPVKQRIQRVDELQRQSDQHHQYEEER
jgi:hypothetical protein